MIIWRAAPSILMPFSMARSVGSSVFPAGNLLSLSTYGRDVARLLRCHRAGCVGGHRGVHAIEEIGDREVVPIAEELEPDERRSRFAAGQIRAMAARAELVRRPLRHAWPARRCRRHSTTLPPGAASCAERCALDVTAAPALTAKTTAAAPTACVHSYLQLSCGLAGNYRKGHYTIFIVTS